MVVAIAEILLVGQVIFNYVLAWALFERAMRCESIAAAMAGFTAHPSSITDPDFHIIYKVRS
jgi:hypothetical protein